MPQRTYRYSFILQTISDRRGVFPEIAVQKIRRRRYHPIAQRRQSLDEHS